MISRYERSLPTPERDKLLTVDKSSLNALSRSEVSRSFINLFLIPDSAFFFNTKLSDGFSMDVWIFFVLIIQLGVPALRKPTQGPQC